MTRRTLAAASTLALLASGLAAGLGAGLPTATAAPPGAAPQVQGGALGLGLQAVVDGADRSTTQRGRRALLDPTRLAVRDDAGRVRVTATPRAGVDAAAYERRARAAGLLVTASEPDLGSLEGFASPDTVRELAAATETGTVVLSPRPVTQAGSVTSNGVPLQRVDRVLRRGIDGRGQTIGVLSDSYDTAATDGTGEPLTIRAADDVRSGDLPGRGNPRNRQPVVVLEDYDEPETASDEGRGMLQITHDVAPAARLCFATAFEGFLGFADNVRRLADPRGGCGADVVVDDVTYFEEPFYSDSPLTDAIDDVAADGVHYFSSAGNSGANQAWEGGLRLVQPRAAAASGIDLSDVPPELYAGGLADLDQGATTDVSQGIAVGDDGSLTLKWDDPDDRDGAEVSEPWFTASGDVTTSAPVDLDVDVPASRVGQQTLFRVDGVPSGSTDVVITLTTPSGEVVGPVDTASSPEVIGLTIAEAGRYRLRVEAFDASSGGPFTAEVSQVVEPSLVGTDLNLMFFDADGAFLGAVDDDNTLTGRPLELGAVAASGDLQVAVGRSTTGRPTASRIQLQLLGDGVLTEHVDPLAPSSSPHSYARGASGVGAYNAFRSLLPESFTSAGGEIPVRFDSSGRPLRRAELRRTPAISGADGGNTTFFVADSVRDDDSLPNFFGTSAAAPHVAAIAALVQQSTGPLRPDRMRARLQRTAFDHDLDPAASGGREDGLSLEAAGGEGDENAVAPPVSMVDDRFFRLSYDGRVPLRSVTLLGETASPTAYGDPGGRSGSSRSAGIVFDPRPTSLGEPGDWGDAGFPFTVGATSGGLRADRVSASYSRSAGDGQFRRMTLSFDAGGMRGGQSLAFGIDRDLAVSETFTADAGNSADELGGAIDLPSGARLRDGLVFEAVRVDGRRITGVMRNELGDEFTALDGFGLVDAEAAVGGR